jgi:flagellar basal body-associated protein FliL
VLYVIFGSESIEFTAGLVSKGLLLIAIGLLIITGSFAAVGASFIDRSPNGEAAKDNGAYGQAITAAVLAIVGGVLIAGLFLYLMFHKPKTKKDTEKDKKKDDTDDDINELRQKLVEEKEAEIDERTAKARDVTAATNKK